LYFQNCLDHVLHYTVHQNANSTEWVTFVHGAGGSSSIWFRQVRAFKNHYNVLLLDLRGHGKSKASTLPSKRYTFGQIGDDVIEVLDNLNIQQSHFVGVSLGTIIIRELADRFPQRVQSMILAGAVMKINLRGRLLIYTGGMLRSLLPYLWLYRLFAFVVMPRKRNRESRHIFIREAKKLYQREFLRWFRMVSQLKPLLALFRLKDSSIPTIYVMGELDYMFLPAIRKLVRKHNSASLAVIPSCGHVVNIEQPNAFNQICLAYLKSGFPKNLST
jgi:pimeloyl-ACP methyl ester carboxylesterase